MNTHTPEEAGASHIFVFFHTQGRKLFRVMDGKEEQQEEHEHKHKHADKHHRDGQQRPNIEFPPASGLHTLLFRLHPIFL